MYWWQFLVGSCVEYNVYLTAQKKHDKASRIELHAYNIKACRDALKAGMESLTRFENVVENGSYLCYARELGTLTDHIELASAYARILHSKI